jgi:hypothetical protein
MRRRDVLFLCLTGGALLAGLVWALSTQSRWVQENKPLRVQRPAVGADGPEPVPASATGIIGTVSDDTRAAMAKEMDARKPRGAVPVARPAPKGRARAITKGEQES